jgi:hypothetical protein
MAMPACAEVNRVMQGLTRIRQNTGEQNKDITVARQAWDWKDTNTVLRYLSDRNPFVSDSGLQTKSCRKRDLGWYHQSVVEYTFKRKNQAIIKSSVKIDDNTVQIASFPTTYTGFQSNT